MTFRIFGEKNVDSQFSDLEHGISLKAEILTISTDFYLMAMLKKIEKVKKLGCFDTLKKKCVEGKKMWILRSTFFFPLKYPHFFFIRGISTFFFSTRVISTFFFFHPCHIHIFFSTCVISTFFFSKFLGISTFFSACVVHIFFPIEYWRNFSKFNFSKNF